MNLLHGSRMKCPLGSTNKRFLLNTLRPCAAENRSGSRSAMTRGAEDSREDCRDRRSRHQYHHNEDREHSKHRRECPRSHSQSSRLHDSSMSQLSSTGHVPRHSSQSNRTRSRSPIRERLATKRSPNRTQK